MVNTFICNVYDKDSNNYATDTMKRCPICGAIRYIHKDIVDVFFMGWSVGCPRYKLNDGLHNHDKNTLKELRLSRSGLSSKEECEQIWREIVKQYV